MHGLLDLAGLEASVSIVVRKVEGGTELVEGEEAGSWSGDVKRDEA